MTIAELHGKLSPDRPLGVSERMEDLLTSDVFGTMKYAGWDKGFLEWLLSAEPAPVIPPPPPIKHFFDERQIVSVTYKFWPNLKNNREPDLAMLIGFDSGHQLLALVEAKYFSGTSDFEVDETRGETDLSGNQIADQVNGLNAMTHGELLPLFGKIDYGVPYDELELKRIHLFITVHTELPKADYENSLKKVGDFWPIPSYWLSWGKLAEKLEAHITHSGSGLDALILDLLLLLKRKGLIPFKGFKTIPVDLENINPSFWNEVYWTSSPIQELKYHSFWN